MLRERRYSGLYTVTTAAIRRLAYNAELRLLHGTALVWRRPEDAAWELASAVALDKNNPVIVIRAASLLVHLNELAAARNYVDHARKLAGDDAILLTELKTLDQRLHAVE